MFHQAPWPKPISFVFSGCLRCQHTNSPLAGIISNYHSPLTFPLTTLSADNLYRLRSAMPLLWSTVGFETGLNPPYITMWQYDGNKNRFIGSESVHFRIDYFSAGFIRVENTGGDLFYHPFDGRSTRSHPERNYDTFEAGFHLRSIKN